MTLTPDELRATAEAAMAGPWRQQGTKIIDGGNWHVAEAGIPSTALHVATFDPPTILAMLAERAADKARIAKLERALTIIAGPPERDPDLPPIYEPRWSNGQCRDIARATLEHGEPGK